MQQWFVEVEKGTESRVGELGRLSLMVGGCTRF